MAKKILMSKEAKGLSAAESIKFVKNKSKN